MTVFLSGFSFATNIDVENSTTISSPLDQSMIETASVSLSDTQGRVELYDRSFEIAFIGQPERLSTKFFVGDYYTFKTTGFTIRKLKSVRLARDSLPS